MAGYIRQSSFSDGDTITAALFNNEFNQTLNAFSNTGGHKHDGTAAEGPVIGLIGDAGETAPNNKVLIDTTNNFIEFYVQVSSNPVQQLYIADGAIIPVTDNDIDLGTSSLEFKDGYIDSITTTGNVGIGGNLTVTGTTTFNGGTITMGDAATDNVVFGADVDSNIIPDDDDTYDLGSASQQWRNIFIDGTAEIDTLAINGTTVTSTAAELNILDGVTASAADINLIDGITNGTVIASKAIITDSDKDITGGRNITISGELDAATLDISGDADIDGTLEADAITIAGVTLAETISDTVGAMVGSNTETGISVTYDDSDNTLDFVIGADSIVSSMLDTNIDIAGTLDVTGVLTTDTNATIAGTLGIAGGSTNGVAISQGAISIKNGGAKSYIDLYCESSNAHYTRIEAAAHGAYSGNVTATLPVTTGTLALTSDIHTTEELQDIIGAMVSSNTESGITVAYQDADGTIDFTVGTLNQDTTGSAATLTTPRAIAVAGDVTGTANFDGSAGISITTTLATDAIVTANITNANVTLAKMAANSVDSDQYVDGSIDTAHIADSQITSAKIADGTIATGDIADDAVTGDKLSNDVTIANDLTVSGDLVVTGSTTQTGSLLSNSNFQALSQNNSGNSTDFGFYGKYVESSTTKFAGLAFDASTDNTFRLFVDTQTAPGSTLNTGATGYAAGTLVSNLTGNVTGNLTGNASGTAATVTTAAQSNITSLGTLTTLTVDNVIINGTTIGHTDDTDLITLSSAVVTVAGEVDAVSLDVSGDIDVDGTSNLDVVDIDGAVDMASTLVVAGIATASTSANITEGALVDGTTAWDAAAKANATLVLEENTTISAPSNAVAGAIISIEVAQHATSGPYTLAWNTVFEFASSTAPTMTATDAKTDIFSFRYNGSVWQEIGRVKTWHKLNLWKYYNAQLIVEAYLLGMMIDNSVKLEADNTEYLNRVIASGGNRKTWTISAWVKRTEISDASHGGGHTIFGVNVSGNEGTIVRFNTGTTAATLIQYK